MEVPEDVQCATYVEVPVTKQVQVATVTKVQKTVHVTQIEFVDKIVEVPGRIEVRVPMVTKVQRTVQAPALEYVDHHVEAEKQTLDDIAKDPHRRELNV